MDACTVEVHRRSRPSRGKVFYLPPCADVDRFKCRDYADRTGGAFFLGNASLEPRPSYLKLVEQLVEGSDIRFFTPPAKSDPRWVKIHQHADLYSNCLVGLNVHRDPSISKECWQKRVKGRMRAMTVPTGLTLCSEQPPRWGTGFWNDGNLPASHVNPRFFEMAACGTLVVSDSDRSELARMFPMAPRAKTPEQFVEFVLHYMDPKNLREAERIGQACSSLIFKRHSYQHRATEVMIRTGFWEAANLDLRSSLGEPEDWLTPQDCEWLTGKSSSVATGHYAPWSPAYGMSLTSTSGSPSESNSLDVQTPWLS